MERADSLAIWTAEVARRLPAATETVVYGRGGPGEPARERIGAVEYRRLPSLAASRAGRGLGRLLAATRVRGPRFDSPLYHLGYAAWVAADVRRQGVDVVHIHNFTQFAPVIRTIAPRARIVLQMHCEWLSDLDRDEVERRLAAVDAVVGASDHVTGLVRRRFPEVASRCSTVWNGVTVPADGVERALALEHAAAARRPHILFVGRVSPEKGLHVLLDAFPAVAAQVPGVRLSIIGPDAETPREMLADLSRDPMVRGLARFYGPREGAYLARLEATVALWPAPLRASVSFSGEVARSELPARYTACDVLVNPSLSEAFGLSLVEAMAAGRPVVATEVGGMKEIVIDGVTGRLCPPDDPTALAAAIVEALRDPSRARAWGEAGRTRARELFSWDRTASALARLYERLAPDAPGSLTRAGGMA